MKVKFLQLLLLLSILYANQVIAQPFYVIKHIYEGVEATSLITFLPDKSIDGRTRFNTSKGLVVLNQKLKSLNKSSFAPTSLLYLGENVKVLNGKEFF